MRYPLSEARIGDIIRYDYSDNIGGFITDITGSAITYACKCPGCHGAPQTIWIDDLTNKQYFINRKKILDTFEENGEE